MVRTTSLVPRERLQATAANGPVGAVDVAAGQTAASVAAALGAQTGGVVNGNTITFEGALSGGIVENSGVFHNVSVSRKKEPVPPPPVVPVPPKPPFVPPPPGTTVKTLPGGITITTTGTLTEKITFGPNTIETHVDFSPGEMSDQLNQDVLDALMAQSALLPQGISLVTFNGSPAFFADYNYDFDITEGLETTSGEGIPGLYFGVITTGLAPEPSTWAMMLLGFVGVGYFGYRKRFKRLTPSDRGPATTVAA